MDSITKKKINYDTGVIRISRVLALFSFIIGTLIILLFYITKYIGFVAFGFYYLVIVTLVNLAFLIRLFFKLIQKKANKKQTIISILILIINIPVAIIYYNIAFTILENISFE